MTTITTKATTTTVATTAKTITTVVTTSATATATTPAVATTTGSGTTATESATATTESGTTETATTGSGTTETATTAGQMRQIMFANQTTFYSGSNNPASVAVGYFDNDNELDIVVANIGYINYIYHVAVFLGIGNGYFRSQTLFPTGSQPYSVAVGDFNNDNRSDIVVANYNGSSVSVLLGYGNGTFANQMMFPTGSQPYSVAVGDFNNDNRSDIVVANYNGSSVSVLLGYGNGTFASQRIFPAGNGPRSIAVGDFNDDNQLDIVVANDGSMNGIFNVGLLLGYGNGTFASQITFSDGYRPYSVTVGDFNNDNRLDIAMANYFSDNVGVRLGYGNGTFAGQKTFTTGAGPWSVAVGDFNNDNRSDIAVANYNGFNVGVLTGDGDGAFPNQTTYSTGVSSFPNAIAVAVLYGIERNNIKESIKFDNNNTFCSTPYCINAANYLLQSIDESVDPCENFYDFACGKWMNSSIIPDDEIDVSILSSLANELNRRLVDLFAASSTSNNELQSILNARILYASCINEEAIETDSLKTILSFIDTELGGWPIIKGSDWSSLNYSLANQLLRLTLYGLNPLYTIVTSIDAINSSSYGIFIDQSKLNLRTKDVYTTENNITIVYREVMREIVLELTNITLDIDTDIADMFALEKSIAQYFWTQTDLVYRANENFRIAIDNVTKVVNSSFDFSDFIHRLYQSVGVNLTEADIPILAACSTKLPYLVLCIQYDRFNAKTISRTSTEQARSIECSSSVNNAMGFAISRLYIEKYFSEQTRIQLQELYRTVRDEFIDMISQASWMDTVSKRRAVEKAQAILEGIGYPEYVISANVTELENQYINYRFNLSYMHNSLLVHRLIATQSLEKLRQPTRRTTWDYPPTTVNAFYIAPYNSILFLAGFLQAPMFHVEAPKYLNFGGIGTIMAHEMTHGFDNIGRFYDKDGNRLSWWTNETSVAFDQKKQCIIDQYSNYTMTQVNAQVDGVLTQGENIADNGGLKASFYAYRKWAQGNPNIDKKLPGLEKYSAEQLFFMSFGHMWCSKVRDSLQAILMKVDFHSPAMYRVIGATSNFVEFDRVFGCKPSQGNSRINKCTVW
ncbi:hypothetical protein I4U23_005280 [Adineta vaga]|nr:hypothetical protein I4U23_005280 [Adineta vaga]